MSLGVKVTPKTSSKSTKTSPPVQQLKEIFSRWKGNTYFDRRNIMTENSPQAQRVLVVLTGQGALDLYHSAVNPTYRNAEHYIAFGSVHMVDEFVIADEPQLIFIDLINGKLDRTLEFINRMKRRNKKIIAVLYTHSQKADPVFKYHVWAGEDDVLGSLRNITRQFLESLPASSPTAPPAEAS